MTDSEIPQAKSSAEVSKNQEEEKNDVSSNIELRLTKVLETQYLIVKALFKKQTFKTEDLEKFKDEILNELNSSSDGFPHKFVFKSD